MYPHDALPAATSLGCLLCRKRGACGSHGLCSVGSVLLAQGGKTAMRLLAFCHGLCPDHMFLLTQGLLCGWSFFPYTWMHWQGVHRVLLLLLPSQ